jgi:hypothetical protein
MIVDYENPLKKMMEEFVPHGKVKAQGLGTPALSVTAALTAL